MGSWRQLQVPGHKVCCLAELQEIVGYEAENESQESDLCASLPHMSASAFIFFWKSDELIRRNFKGQ